MHNLPFVEEILADLRRFKECVEDGQDVDLGRDRFDLLTQLGLLERVQRSPALWLMTKAGENAIAQPAAGVPKWSCLNDWFLSLEPGRQAVLREDKWMLAGAAFDAGRQCAAPPAAAHGDEAVLWIECDPSAAKFDRLPKDWQFLFSTKFHMTDPGDRSANVVFALYSAMRAQAGEGGE